jgi:hypothetical protein
MIAKCVRSDSMAVEEEASLAGLQTRHIRWVDYN